MVGRQRLGNPTSLSRSPVHLYAIHTLFVILLEPQAHRRTMHPQILGDGLALPSSMGHYDRLASVVESSVSGRFEELFQVHLFRGRQSNAPHLCSSPPMRNCIRGYRKKDANSSDACIRTCTGLGCCIHCTWRGHERTYCCFSAYEGPWWNCARSGGVSNVDIDRNNTL